MDKDIGIYRIVNLETNKSYIGKSRNIPSRKRQHFMQLRKGTHPCFMMQRDYDNLGPDFFDFEILENCDACDLDEYERVWHARYEHKPLYSDVYKTIPIPLPLVNKVESMIQEYKDNRP